MAVTAQSTNCHLLRLPPELREQIYTYIFDHKIQCTLTIGNDDKINQMRSSATGPPGAATTLLRTCRLIYSETAASFYRSTVFSVFIFGDDRGHETKFEALLDPDNPLLKRMRRLRLVVWIWREAEIDVAFRRLRRFANCLEEAHVEIKSLSVNINVWQTSSESGGALPTTEPVERRREELLNGICGGVAPNLMAKREHIFRSILELAKVDMGIHGSIGKARVRSVNLSSAPEAA